MIKFEYLHTDHNRSLAPFFSPLIASMLFGSIFIVECTLLLFWPKKDLIQFAHLHQIPLVFFVVFAVSFVILCYLNLIWGSGEAIPREAVYHVEQKNIITVEEENAFIDYGLVKFLCHSLLLFLPILPFLMVSASISGLPFQSFFKACSFVFLTSFLFRLFGFLIYLRFKKHRLVVYFLTRGFFLFFIAGTLSMGTYANPFLLLYALHKDTTTMMGYFLSDYSIFMSAVFIGIIGLIVLNRMMINRNMIKEKSG